MKIELPHNFTPRPYQKDFFDSIYDYTKPQPELLKKRGVIVRPRRHGKDKSIFNMLVIPEMMKRVGLYYYVFPEYAQARKAFWENIDNDGFPLLKHIPEEFIASINNSEMKITLVNGSILRVVGTDKNIDGVVGSNPVGIIFSEWALCNPIVWDYMKPMLMGNGGRAYFVYTPRGHNHGYDIAMTAEKFTDSWAYGFTTAKDTYDSDGNRIFSDKQLQEEIDQGMDPDLWEQEYMCSFEAAMKGAIYSDQLKKATEENRICKVPHEEGLQVYTFWDLGMADTTAIWFVQLYGKEVRVIDHYEMSGKSLDHYVDILNAKGYNYKGHYLPHDSKVRELISGTSRIDYLEKAGLTNIEITPNISIDQGIDATRRNFKNMWFDVENCERGLLALKSYVYAYDDKNKMWSRSPKHDWASNSADALRYLGVVLEKISKISRPQKAITVDYSKFL